MFWVGQDVDDLVMLWEWIKRTQSITVGLLRLAAREGQLINDDLRKLKLQPRLAQNWLVWRKTIR